MFMYEIVDIQFNVQIESLVIHTLYIHSHQHFFIAVCAICDDEMTWRSSQISHISSQVKTREQPGAEMVGCCSHGWEDNILNRFSQRAFLVLRTIYNKQNQVYGRTRGHDWSSFRSWKLDILAMWDNSISPSPPPLHDIIWVWLQISIANINCPLWLAATSRPGLNYWLYYLSVRHYARYISLLDNTTCCYLSNECEHRTDLS